MDSHISDKNMSCSCPEEINRVDICKTDCFPFGAFASIPSGILCMPILTDKIYDCINICSSFPWYINEGTFTIDNGGNFKDGDPIYINQISLSYNCIGISSLLPFTLNGQEYILNALSSVNLDSNCSCSSQIPFFNRFGATILNSSYLPYKCRTESSADTVPSYFFQEINNLYICNMTINASGSIGSNSFSSHLTYEGLTSLNDLGFNPVISTPLCISHFDTHINIFQSINFSLQLNSIAPISTYSSSSPASFPANVYYTLNLDTGLTSTAKTPVNAFTPNLTF